MSARSRMTMRAQIRRNLHEAQDDYGQQAQGWQIVVSALPCRAWASRGIQIFRSTGELTVDSPGAIFPHGADVCIGDRLEITDRLGKTLFERLEVVAVMPRAGHTEVSLRSVDA